MIKWEDITEDEDMLISEIVKRAKSLSIPMSSRINLMMDISAAHLDIPLDLKRLLASDNFNFQHDVVGIMHNMNRDTGKLENCFLPRHMALC